jgi:hypothetical protein
MLPFRLPSKFFHLNYTICRMEKENPSFGNPAGCPHNGAVPDDRIAYPVKGGLAGPERRTNTGELSAGLAQLVPDLHPSPEALTASDADAMIGTGNNR